MTELKITDLFHLLADEQTGMGHARFYSGSIAELGPSAAETTWENCRRDGKKLLTMLCPDSRRPSVEVLDDIRQYVRSFGAWDSAEINTWPATDLLAFLLQDIAATVREWDKVGDCWADYQAASEAGRVSGRLYVTGADDEVWYNISN